MKNTFSLCLWRCTLAMGLIAWTNKGHNTPTPPSPVNTPGTAALNGNTTSEQHQLSTPRLATYQSALAFEKTFQ